MAMRSFSLTGVILYVGGDWLLQRLEARAGRRFEHRSLVFFALLLGMALLAFALIRTLAGA